MALSTTAQMVGQGTNDMLEEFEKNYGVTGQFMMLGQVQIWRW